MSKLKELKEQADALGIEYAKNIGEAKLAQKIEEHKSLTAEDSAVQEDEVNPDIVKMAEEVPVNEAPAQTRNKGIRELAAELKKKALKTRVVTISNNDKRDNHVTTTCYLSCENQYFGISKIVPLDIPVELEQGLIDQAEAAEIMLHVDEVVEGKRTGNKTMKMVKRYLVSYPNVEK